MADDTSQGAFGRGINRLNPKKPIEDAVFHGKTTIVDTTTRDFRKFDSFESIDDYKLKRMAQLE
jgi:hypothetical protein